MVSVVIPTLNEARSIGATLDACSKLSTRVDVTLVDGGSNDDTREIASAYRVRVISSQRGRGAQLHAGACASRGEILWFLHADTRPSPDTVERILEALSDSAVVAGNFRVRFDGPRLSSRFLTWLYPRLRLLGLCYGDSAIFVRREAYDRVGGFKPFPIFEDLDLIKRLRKQGRIVHLPAVVVTSSRRFEGRSFPLMFTRWSILQLLYWLGAKPATLARLYAPVRLSKRQDATAVREERRRPATD